MGISVQGDDYVCDDSFEGTFMADWISCYHFVGSLPSNSAFTSPDLPCREGSLLQPSDSEFECLPQGWPLRRSNS